MDRMRLIDKMRVLEGLERFLVLVGQSSFSLRDGLNQICVREIIELIHMVMQIHRYDSELIEIEVTLSKKMLEKIYSFVDQEHN